MCERNHIRPSKKEREIYLATENKIVSLAQEKSAQLPTTDPRLQMVVVIPVYKEFKFGRIKELLSDLTEQTLGVSEFEALLIVNNQSLHGKGFDPIGSQDNKELISYIQEEKKTGRYTNIHAIDCTDGELGYRRIGQSWGLGNEIGKNRLDEANVGKEGVLVRLDADASVKPDFLANILDLYSQDPTIDAITVPRLPLLIDYSSEDMYLGNAHEFISKVMQFLHGERIQRISGPTISFRAKLQENKNIRTYMDHALNSDYHIGELLSLYCRMVVSSFPRVFVGDRVRAEGIDANARDSYVDRNIRWMVARNIYQELTFLSLPYDAFFDSDVSERTQWCESIVRQFCPDRYEDFISYKSEEDALAQSIFSNSRVDQDLVTLGSSLFAVGRLLLNR